MSDEDATKRPATVLALARWLPALAATGVGVGEGVLWSVSIGSLLYWLCLVVAPLVIGAAVAKSRFARMVVLTASSVGVWAALGIIESARSVESRTAALGWLSAIAVIYGALAAAAVICWVRLEYRR